MTVPGYVPCMDPMALFVKYLPYMGGAMAVCMFLEGFIDNVVRPAVLKSASKRDDYVLENYVDGPLRFVSMALSYMLRAGGRK